MAIIDGNKIVDIDSVNKTIKALIDGLELVKKEAVELSNVITKDLKKSLSDLSTNSNTESYVKFEALKKEAENLTVALKELNKTQSELITALNELNTVQSKTNESKAKTKKLTDEEIYQNEVLKKAQKDKVQAIKNEIAIENTLGDSLTRKRLIQKDLLAQYDQSGKAIRDKMLPQIVALEKEIRDLEQSTGRHQRSVGDYKKGFDGLGMSFSQLTREAPAFANSMQTGFMAISNNIPMFIDQIGMAKARIAQMNAEGIKTPGLFRTIVSSMLSWNTLISVGVTLLTVYGKDLVIWIGNLFKTKDAIEKVKEAQKGLNDVYKTAAKDASDEVGKLETFYKISQDKNKSLELRKQAVDNLQKQFPDYFKNLTDEEILVGKAKTAYVQQRAAIMELARTKAIQSKIDEQVNSLLEKELELDKLIADEVKQSVAANSLKANSLKDLSDKTVAYNLGMTHSVSELTNSEEIQTLNQLRNTQSKIATTAKEKAAIQGVIDMYLSKINVLDKVEEKEKEKDDKTAESFAQMKLRYAELGTQLEDSAEKISKTNTLLQIFNNLTKGVFNTGKDAEKQNLLLAESFKGVGNAAFQTTTDIEKFSYELKEAVKGVDKFFQDYGSSINSIGNSLDTVLQVNADKWAETTAKFEEQIGEQESIVKEELTALNNGLANSYASEKAELEKLEEQKAESVEKEQEYAITQVRIKEALAVANMVEAVSAVFAADGGAGTPGVIAALASVAAMVAEFYALESELQSFGEGGWIDGKKHSEGGTKIVAERDEFMVKAKSAVKSPNLLEMVNNGYIDDSFLPAIEAYKKGNEINYIVHENRNLDRNTDAINNLTSAVKTNTKITDDGKIITILGNRTIIKRMS